MQDGSDRDLERDEEQMIRELDDLTKVKEVEGSSLKMGYNEADYVYKRQEHPNYKTKPVRELASCLQLPRVCKCS